ncbi:MAG TPA: DUF1043 family protein [Pseudomonadales bacterium]|nr:DUF1043 family protein [Pseudomonadales bacterium]HND13542.1 DUF1043 family protein [Pseudomonadales bacterium]
MYNSVVFWITTLSCLLAGAVAGWLLRRAFDPSEQRQRELERRLHESEMALHDYRNQVTEHFRGTAERVNRLTEDYRELHQHLSGGAIELCDVSAADAAPLLTSLGAAPHAGAATSDTATTVNPPLDYAPRSSPDAPGILNEEYGLDRPRGGA